MKKLDLNKTLRTILLVLAIVLMLIKLINKASAAEYDSSNIDSFDDLIDLFSDTLSDSEYNTIINTIHSYDNIHALYDSTDHTLVLEATDTLLSFNNSIMNNSNTSGIYMLTDVDTVHTCVVLTLSSNSCYLRKETSTSSRYTGYTLSQDLRNMDLFCLVSNSETLIDRNAGAIYMPYARADFYYTSGYQFIIYKNQLSLYLLTVGTFGSYHAIEINNYTDTGFFNIWTSISQNDNKMLNITWDTSVFPSTGSMNYTKSVMDLTIEVNGTAQVVSFDSDENPELFPTSSGTYIPYKFLQKVADLAEVSSSDSFYLTMVSLTQYAYPSGGSSSSATAYNETSLCSVDLGEISVDVPAVTPVLDIPISDTNISNTTYFQDVVGGVISSDTSYPIPSWANVCRIGLSDSAFPLWDSNFTYNDIVYNRWVVSFDLRLWYSYQSSDDPSLNASNIVSFTGDIRPLYQWIGNDVGQFFDMYYFDNVREFCDVFILDLYINNTSTTPATWDLSQRLIFYTDRYFQRLQIESLGNIQSMIEANTYYTKAIYDYATVRFDGMAQSLEKLRISNNSLLGSINANIINLQGLVSSGTDRIVNAIQGISGGGLSVSDLSGTLNTLFMPSFEWDTVNYQDYLDSLGVLALPFEFVFDTQSIIKNNYSASIVLPVNDFSVPLGTDQNQQELTFEVFKDHDDFVYSPTSIFPSAIWSIFQYLCAFGLVIGEAWFTYVHIFRKEEKSGDF